MINLHNINVIILIIIHLIKHIKNRLIKIKVKIHKLMDKLIKIKINNFLQIYNIKMNRNRIIKTKEE